MRIEWGALCLSYLYRILRSSLRILLLILPDARYTFHVASTTLHEPFFSSRLLSDLKSRRSYIFSLLSTYLTSKRDLSFGHSSHRTGHRTESTAHGPTGVGTAAGGRHGPRRGTPGRITSPLPARHCSAPGSHPIRHRTARHAASHIPYSIVSYRRAYRLPVHVRNRLSTRTNIYTTIVYIIVHSCSDRQ